MAGENSFKLGGFALGVCRREYLYGMVVEVVHRWIIVHDESGSSPHVPWFFSFDVVVALEMVFMGG